MRSNGAVHIGNDTFLAATKDVTDSLFLFSSSFPSEEQLASLPLARKVRFNPHAALPCTAIEHEQYTAAAAAAAAFVASRAPSETTADLIQRDAAKTTSKDDLPEPLFRHSFYASSDGHQIAVMSNVLRHHYIIDITVEPAAVCELEMPEIVRSVCWHPVAQHVLYVLLLSGDMMIYDTSRSFMGVVLPRHRRLALQPLVLRCLTEADEELAGSDESPAGTSAPDVSASKTKGGKNGHDGASTRSGKGSCHHKAKSPSQASSVGASPPLFVSPSVYTVNTNDRTLPIYEVHTTSSPTIGTLQTVSHLSYSPERGMAERKAFDEVIPIDKEPDDELSSGVDESAASTATVNEKGSRGVMDTLPRRTAQTDLVDVYALPPTSSMPAILLLLSSSGDVYAMHLSEEDTLPVMATADIIDDGRVRTFEEERRRLAALMERTAKVNAEVHHLIHGELAKDGDEALAVRGYLIDVDAGTHAVFFCTANGTVKGAWVSEPDLLARHRAAHVVSTGEPNISFTVNLDGRGGAVRECLSPAVPSTTHTVTMIQSDNLCLLRCGETGEASYLLALPCWDRQRKGWSCWRPTREGKRATTDLRDALPLLSTGNAVPSPIALRLPYDTRGSSVALGKGELILVPRVSTVKPGLGERHRIFSVALLSLLRSALYARCGTLQLHPITGEVKKALSTVATTVAEGSISSATSAAAASHASLLKLVNMIPTCHRRWLCVAPQAEVDAATVELATAVERQTKDLEQRERLQVQRRERLMARVAALESRVSNMSRTYDKWQQTLLDAIVHRRGAAAVQTANDRLGEVHALLNEWEHQQ